MQLNVLLGLRNLAGEVCYWGLIQIIGSERGWEVEREGKEGRKGG